MKEIKLQTGSRQTPMRLDVYLTNQIENISRTQAQRLINADQVQVNNQRVKRSNFTIEPNMEVSVCIPFRHEVTLKPQPVEFEIIYEDDDILVINKPAGLVVHPAHGHWDNTLANGILHHLVQSKKINELEMFTSFDVQDDLRPGIVHRLDKGTSGIMVIALNDLSKKHLANSFKNRSIKKTYLALVAGKLTPGTGQIEAPITRDKNDRKKMSVSSVGKEAVTYYEVLRYYKKNNKYPENSESLSYIQGINTLVKLIPQTGRTHQLRVHMSSIDYPIVGDKSYANHTLPGLKRQFLHAFSLSFYHPRTDEEVYFEAPLAKDLLDSLQYLDIFEQ